MLFRSLSWNTSCLPSSASEFFSVSTIRGARIKDETIYSLTHLDTLVAGLIGLDFVTVVKPGLDEIFSAVKVRLDQMNDIDICSSWQVTITPPNVLNGYSNYAGTELSKLASNSYTELIKFKLHGMQYHSGTSAMAERFLEWTIVKWDSTTTPFSELETSVYVKVDSATGLVTAAQTTPFNDGEAVHVWHFKWNVYEPTAGYNGFGTYHKHLDYSASLGLQIKNYTNDKTLLSIFMDETGSTFLNQAVSYPIGTTIRNSTGGDWDGSIYDDPIIRDDDNMTYTWDYHFEEAESGKDNQIYSVI